MSFRFHFGRPQQFAAAVLALFFAATVFLIGRAPLTESDYRYALCGREMWEKPAPAAGYFTTCGNMQGDGSLAYRTAALPLTIYLATERLFSRGEANPTGGSIYDLRHQIHGTAYLLRVPFALAATLLGAGLWWVTRRLFGNTPGAFALALYCLSPMVLRAATTPNNEILAAWGLYATVYLGLGIAHAMYGPRRKWRPRIVLFTLALGFTATAHVLAAVLALVISALLMLYVAERRRTLILPILIGCSLGAMVLVWINYTMRLGIFLYVFTAGAARFTLAYEPLLTFVRSPWNLALAATAAVAFVLYLVLPRSRYFGNTAPFLITLVLLPLATTEVLTTPTLWMLPFLLTFIAGVFSDALETRSRKLFFALMATVLLSQSVLTATAFSHGR